MHVDEQILRRAIVDQAETRREPVSVDTIHWVYVYVDLQTGFLIVPGIDIEGYLAVSPKIFTSGLCFILWFCRCRREVIYFFFFCIVGSLGL